MMPATPPTDEDKEEQAGKQEITKAASPSQAESQGQRPSKQASAQESYKD